MESLYNKIKKICEDQNLTIMELEKRAGLGNGVIGKWRESKPLIDSVIKVANALDVPLEKLLED